MKEKKNLSTSSSQLKANQAPDPPWGDRLTYTDQMNVTNLQDLSNLSNARDGCALGMCCRRRSCRGLTQV